MDEDTISSVEALAAALGRKPRSLHYLFNQGLREACRYSDGSYSLELAQAWLNEHGKGGKKDPLAGLKKRELRVKIAGRHEDLLSKRQKREAVAGQLIYRDEVLEDFSELLAHARPIIDALPDEIAKELPQDLRVEVLQLVTHAVERFYHHICSWVPPGGADEPAAASA